MADDSSSLNSSAASASQPETVRSSSKTPRQIYRSWALTPNNHASESERRRQNLLEALTKFISANDGHVISPPGQRFIRIEIPQGSNLPVSLAEMGYQPVLCGTTTRISYRGFDPMDIIEVTLEK
jgi:hypothetical protein